MVSSNLLPRWLEALLREKFFNACVIHEYAKKNEKNIFCLDCCTSICPHCLSPHRSHRLLQVLSDTLPIFRLFSEKIKETTRNTQFWTLLTLLFLCCYTGFQNVKIHLNYAKFLTNKKNKVIKFSFPTFLSDQTKGKQNKSWLSIFSFSLKSLFLIIRLEGMFTTML